MLNLFQHLLKKGREAVSKVLCHCGRSVAKTRNLLIINVLFFKGWRVKPAMTGF